MPKALQRLPTIPVSKSRSAPAPEIRTRVIDCDAGSCLLITGERADPEAGVKVNGHDVATAGRRRWRSIIPLSAVREWAEPHDCSITVAVEGSERKVDLPIGLLGGASDLSFLVVRVS